MKPGEAKQRLAKIDKEIKDIVINKKHPSVSCNECHLCKRWEELIKEKEQLFPKVLTW